MTWFIELFAGTAALSRVLIGGMSGNRPRIEAPVGYMGAKNDLAPFILHKARIRPGEGAWKATLNDASTIGIVTGTLLGPEGQRVADTLRKWKGEKADHLWRRLYKLDAPKDPVDFAAWWLWLQARSASGVPLWWDGTRIVSMDGHGRGPYPAWQATCRPASQKGTSRGSTGGIRSPATISRRIEAMRAAMCGHKIEILTMRVADYAGLLCGDIGDAVAAGIRVVVYLDPPYQGSTGYELGCPRDTVLGMAMDLRRAGAEVIVSEAEGLPLDGWHHVQLPSRRKPEWLTMSHPPGQAVGDLFVGGAA